MRNLISRIYRNWKYGDPVIVVSGLPRSGTSMLMRMLERGGVETLTDKIREPDEDNPKGYYELERVKELDKKADKAWIKEGRGKAIKVISQLLKELPNDCRYQVVFMDRHLDEVIASQNKMLIRRGEELGQPDAAKTEELFRRHLMNTKLWLEGQPNFDVLYMEHRSCITKARSESRRLAEFLQLDLNLEQMASAVDPDLYRNRQGS